jgi:hypothetical protein
MPAPNFPTDAPAAGSIYLDDIRLDIDPEEYEPLNAPRRGSEHRLLNGGTVIQDRGVSIGDHKILLRGRLYNRNTMVSLWTTYRKTGETFTLTDWEGSSYTCAFAPGNSLVFRKVQGTATAYDYEISLNVISIESWLGGDYPASS